MVILDEQAWLRIAMAYDFRDKDDLSLYPCNGHHHPYVLPRLPDFQVPPREEWGDLPAPDPVLLISQELRYWPRFTDHTIPFSECGRHQQPWFDWRSGYGFPPVLDFTGQLNKVLDKGRK